MNYFIESVIPQSNEQELVNACVCILNECHDGVSCLPSSLFQFKTQAISKLKADGYLDEDMKLTEKGRGLLKL